MSTFFHEAQRLRQSAMETTGIAERIESTRRHEQFTDADRDIIGQARFFFLASGAPDGRLDGSVKCGPAGFVQACGGSQLRFPDYDGNGMFRSIGNIDACSKVALLFVEFWGDKRKLRIHGIARVLDDKHTVQQFRGAQLVTEVAVTDIFPNCPRYLPTFAPGADSEYVAALGHEALEPAWKSKPDLAEYVHRRRSA